MVIQWEPSKSNNGGYAISFLQVQMFTILYSVFIQQAQMYSVFFRLSRNVSASENKKSTVVLVQYLKNIIVHHNQHSFIFALS